MKNLIRVLCIALCAFMVLGVFASCKDDKPEVEDGSQSADSGDGTADSGTESEGDGSVTDTDSGESVDSEAVDTETEADGETDTETDTDTETETETDTETDKVTDTETDTESKPPEPVTKGKYTVMTFNIRYLDGDKNSEIEARRWDNRKAAVCNFMLESGAGIIGINEIQASQYFDVKAALADKYEVIWYASYPDANPQGNAVAYDRTVWQLVGTPEHFWLSPTPDKQSSGWETNHYRSCINALFEHIETGARLNVFVTHLDHKKEADMVNGISLILEKISESEYPVYLCGDFNCTPGSKAYNIAAGAMQDAQKVALDSDEGSTFNSWGEITDAEKYIIDYCFFSKNNVVVKTYDICDGRWGANNENLLSDHKPVLVTVDIQSDPIEYPDMSGVGGVEDFYDTDRSTFDE